MDFHSLLRRDLQFLCKRNKIPAKMTNLAMADALKSLETNDANVLQSPASVAKLPPSTAARTTRRKTAMKAEPQSSSQLVVVNRSCRLKSKSLHGEMNQENVTEESKTYNVKIEVNVAKTPAAWSTRKASAAASCKSKVQESKKGELKCMADLSLMTKETEQKVSAQEKNPDVIPGRDLSASMEKECEMLKNDCDQVIGGLNMSVENTETNSLVQGDKQEETLQANEAICEEGLKKNDTDQEIIDLENCVDLDEFPVLEHANLETNNNDKEWKDIQAFEKIEQTIQENHSEILKINTSDEDIMVDQTEGDSETEPEEDDSSVDSDGTFSEADSKQANHQETEQTIQVNDSETVKINTFDEDTCVDQTELEEDDSSVDSDDTISEADSNQAVQGSDIAEEEMILSESEGSVTAPSSPLLLLEQAEVKTAPLSPFAAESISPKNSAMKLVSVDNNNKENNMEMMVSVSDNGEINAEAKKQKKKKVEFDEENLKDVSIRQLVKMVRELSIKGSNNRTALQMLPENNQITD
ncbi:hypothetical protein Bca52824_040277 [Brassica carinata]|uniref:Uncharacterized protein n=1 Tax=Brassica carinata TaxID=52824 RepID=A0A8X7RT57_BRACI|nr:hypothetical protein Bca52824_040277 [Brassica carinata]